MRRDVAPEMCRKRSEVIMSTEFERLRERNRKAEGQRGARQRVRLVRMAGAEGRGIHRVSMWSTVKGYAILRKASLSRFDPPNVRIYEI